MQPPQSIPQFGKVPLLGQRQQPNEQQAQQQMQAQVQAAIGQLSINIYSKLAINHITLRLDQSTDQNKLRQLAKNALAASKCYFEGLNIISQESPEDQ
jgi:predicted metalloenzyme YecM